MPFWGCVRGNASLQVDFEPETTPVLILSTQVDAGTYLPSTRQHRHSIAASRHHHRLTQSPHHSYCGTSTTQWGNGPMGKHAPKGKHGPKGKRPKGESVGPH